MSSEQVYRSKFSLFIVIPLAALMIGLTGYLLFTLAWIDFIITLLIFGFIAHLFASTAYTIMGNQLRVKSGFFIDIKIDITKIKAVAETNSVLSAPALSLDRLEIFYNTYDSVVISPPNKAEFIQALKNINNNIEIKLKEKNA